MQSARQNLENLSIIIPVLNEEASITANLATLADARRIGVEVIVADGGSADGTAERARELCDQVIAAPRGRASQMNAGARAASGDILLFLHADTRLPAGDFAAVVSQMAGSGAGWGRFDVTIDGKSWMLKVIAAMINMRSRWTGIATGDQAIFVRSDLFKSVDGFPDIPLMEDIALSKILKRHGPPICLREKVTTSGRRWGKNGIWRTIWTMWRLRAAYFFGADPVKLARRYGYRPREDDV